MQAIHEGVILAIDQVRSEYWIPVVRHIVKRKIKESYGCKRYHTKPNDEPMSLLRTITTGPHNSRHTV